MPILFDSWGALGRIILVGALAYFALVLILRASGKRTLSKLNAFDLVVTVALGSTLATVLLSKDVALAEGVVAKGLGELQARYPDVDIGSYPFYRSGRYGTSLVCRSSDEARLAAATAELRAMLTGLGAEPLVDMNDPG